MELRRLAPYYAFRSASGVARALPGGVAGGVARGVGAAFALTSRQRRAMVARHLQRVRGRELRGVALERSVQRAFASYARYWEEFFRLPAASPAAIEAAMSYEGLDRVEEALAAGRGVIIVLPHLGGWEWGGAWMASVLRHPLTVVVEALEPPELFDWFAGLRRALGMTIVPLGPAAGGALLRTLRSGGAIALVADRDIGGTGVEVDFFGERTRLPGGAATLALRTGAAVLPIAVYFEPHGGHRGVVRPPIAIERSGSFRADVACVTQQVALELEALIRRAPEQWHLMQPNWPSDHEFLRQLRG